MEKNIVNCNTIINIFCQFSLRSPVTKVKESSHGTPSQNEPTDSPISGFFEKF